MDRKSLRPIGSLLFLCFLTLFMAFRSPGFENIRTVQVLLIFIAGALAGLAIGVFRHAMMSRTAEK